MAWPQERRTQAIAAWITVGGISSGLGPTIGAVLSARLQLALRLPGERGDRRAHAPAAALRLKIDTEKHADALLPDPVGIVLLSTTLAFLALAMVQGRTWGWTDPKILGSWAAAVVLSVLFALRSKGHPAPVLDMNLLAAATTGSRSSCRCSSPPR